LSIFLRHSVDNIYLDIAGLVVRWSVMMW